MEHMVEIIALVAVLGLVVVMLLQHRMIMRSQAFFMVAKSSQAYNKVIQSRIERKFEQERKKDDIEHAQRHKRFKDLINGTVGSEKDIAEFMPKGI